MTTKINSEADSAVRKQHTQRHHVTRPSAKVHECGGAVQVSKAKNSGWVGTALQRGPVVVTFSSNSGQRSIQVINPKN